MSRQIESITGIVRNARNTPDGPRVSPMLMSTPYFFAGNGGHVLYGRSLIYRWGVLTPLVLAYQQKLLELNVAQAELEALLRPQSN